MMKHSMSHVQTSEMEQLMSVCCGNPQGDELPQVAGDDDIVLDIYSDMLNIPREFASGRFHHQFGDQNDFDSLMH